MYICNFKVGEEGISGFLGFWDLLLVSVDYMDCRLVRILGLKNKKKILKSNF